MFENILVAYDGSATSRTALAKAYELAQAEHASVTVVTVAPTVAPLVALAPASVEGLRAELHDWAGKKLREAEAAAPHGLTVRTVQRSGHVGEEVVSEIESGGYDLVVLGSRGHGRISSGILGSVNAHVHFHAKVPTLTIDAPESSSTDPAAEQRQSERATTARPPARVG
jgi:nucleotide-binding universal stress UspA family protein